MSGAFEWSSADRLTAIGLPPRAQGWVPAQDATVNVDVDAADPQEPPVPAADLPRGTRMDDLRLALAARLPGALAVRVEQMSNAAVMAVAAVVAGVVVLVGVKLHGHHAQGYSSGYSAASYRDSPAASSTSDPAMDGSSIIVDVGGRVRRPGLVTLPLGARVADAIRAAGGPLRRRELARIDLAARVVDGQLLMVGVASAAAGAPGGGSSAPVSLSTASLDELETLPGVGPVTAQKIIDWRTAHGGFTSVSQLQQVSGIGPARYAQLSPLVTP